MTIIQMIGYIGYVVGAIIILTSQTKTNNMKDLKERVEILEREREYARDEHLANQKAISNLEGQLSTYKEIPLKSIARSLEALPKIVTSNEEILGTLKNRAEIIAHERTNPIVQHVDTQEVGTQFISKETK